MPTQTPNIGLQIPDFNQANWQVPLNFDLGLLDLIFGGSITVPALSVTLLTAGNASSLINAALIAGTVSEQPTATVPGTTYTLSQSNALMFILSVNGIVQRPGIDFTISGQTITFSPSVATDAAVFAVYLHS
jgi:hypothetical protein